MKKYLFLFVGVAAFIAVDLLSKYSQKNNGYSDEERLSNLEKARQAKKVKSMLKDHEEILGTDESNSQISKKESNEEKS